MNNLKNYIKVYPWLDKKLCNQIRNELKKVTWQKHYFYNAKHNLSSILSGEQEPNIFFGKIPTSDKLTKKVWEVINQYICVDLKSEYFNGWEGFTDIRFNQYQKGNTMAKHIDHVHDMFEGERKGIPVLSIVGLLNDDFEGGEFIMFDDMEIKIKQGEILIFPSIFLYPHKVNPVTKGIRESFVSWVW
jgi:hypothetical protein